MILVDAGVLIALYNADDDFHDRCVALWDDSRTHFLVSPLVVTEVCYFLARDHGPEMEATFLESFAAGQLVLATVTAGDVNRMAELVRQYSDLTKAGLVARTRRSSRWPNVCRSPRSRLSTGGISPWCGHCIAPRSRCFRDIQSALVDIARVAPLPFSYETWR